MSLLKRYLLLPLALFASLSGQAAPPICEHDLQPWGEYSFDPEKVLRANGLDPNQITFKLEPLNCPMSEGWLLVTYYASKKIGETSIDIEPQGIANVDSSEALDKSVKIKGKKISLRGKGLGTLSYLIAAHIAWKKAGMRLERTDSLTEYSRAVWRRFRKAGVAKKTKSGVVIFRKSFLKSSAIKPVERFFRRHKKS